MFPDIESTRLHDVAQVIRGFAAPFLHRPLSRVSEHVKQAELIRDAFAGRMRDAAGVDPHPGMSMKKAGVVAKVVRGIAVCPVRKTPFLVSCQSVARPVLEIVVGKPLTASPVIARFELIGR